MMEEQKLQFRVGLLVLFSALVAGVLVVRFGGLKQYWKSTWAVAIHFDEAPGVQPGTPVKVNGITIGRTRKVVLEESEPGVLVVVDIESGRKLRTDTRPSINRSLFGDSTIEFTPGTSSDFLPPNTKVQGAAPQDPLQAVHRMEGQLSETLASFHATSEQWQLVARNFNELMQTERGSLTDVVERTAIALDDFAKTMRAAHETLASTNQVIADPAVQQSLRDSIAALPVLVTDTRDTIAAAKASIQKVSESFDKVNANLAHVEQATAPLAEHSRSMVTRLDGGLIQLESLLTELNTFASQLNDRQGTLQQLVSDPQLYENLNRSAGALAVLLNNLEPTLRDARIFADKVARHPELLGVKGAFSGSSGLKEVSEAAAEEPRRR